MYYARSQNGLAATPSFSTVVAVAGIHRGCIQTGGLASCADRSLLDFFQIVAGPGGRPQIVYTAGQADSQGNSLTVLAFTHIPA